jgi:ligand-binding sensor domain-containing protein
MEFSQFTIADGLADDVINSLALSRNGEVFVGTSSGLSKYSNGKITTYDFLRKSLVSQVLVDPSDMIWVGTLQGLSRINPKNDHFENLDETNGFPRINSICFDREGNLWTSS